MEFSEAKKIDHKKFMQNTPSSPFLSTITEQRKIHCKFIQDENYHKHHFHLNSSDIDLLP